MEELLILIVGLGTVATGAFYFGWRTGKGTSDRFHKEISKAYKDLIESNKKLEKTPNAIARSTGFGEGYEQGVADAYRAIEKLIHGAPDNETAPR